MSVNKKLKSFGEPGYWWQVANYCCLQSPDDLAKLEQRMADEPGYWWQVATYWGKTEPGDCTGDQD